MSTSAKIIFGYTDHMGYWNVEKEYIRWMDGYSEAVIPQLKEHTNTENGVDIEAFNDAMVNMNKAIAEAHYSFVNELLDEGISFKEAERFVSKYIDLSNISLKEEKGKYFIVIEPRIKEELFYE